MRKLIVPVLVLLMIFICTAALADGNADVTLELKKDKLPVYAAEDPFVAWLLSKEATPEAEGIDEVIILPMKKSLKLNVSVKPKTVKNKKVTIAVSDGKDDIVRVKGDSITGTGVGETVLTIASVENPDVALKYRVIVIQPVTRLTVNAPEKTVRVGETISLTAVCTPENATIQGVTWKSGDERIATVDENGTVTGVKRGNVRINAVTTDGSNIRANVSIRVVQQAESITLDKEELTVDIGKNAVLKAAVLPKNTDNKDVTWTSSDESIATVNKQGRINGLNIGTCEILCISKSTDTVTAKAVVHVQQPVKSIKFEDAPVIFVDDSAKLTWTVEPADATNKAITLKSGNEKILKVSEDGTITGVQAGETYVSAVSADGSNRKARVKVIVYQHIKSVNMRRKTAYINVKGAETTGAVFEPSKFINANMTWKSDDETIATVKPEPKNSSRVKISGVKEGSTRVTGVTEDGGLITAIDVKVGNWNKMLKIRDAYIDGKGRLCIDVRNVSEDLPITSVTLEIEAYNRHGDPVAINTKDGSNIVEANYTNSKKALQPGKSTPEDKWKLKDYDDAAGFQRMVVRIVKYQIDNDWVVCIREKNQPKFEYNPYKK